MTRGKSACERGRRNQLVWVAIAFTLAFIGCGNEEEELELAPGTPVVVTKEIAPGLEQALEVSSLSVESGGLVSFESTLTNQSSDSLVVQSRICGLGVRTPITTRRHPSLACAGYSMTQTLGPADWVSEGVILELLAPPGLYPLSVIHALDPPGTLTVEIEILDDGASK